MSCISAINVWQTVCHVSRSENMAQSFSDAAAASAYRLSSKPVSHIGGAILSLATVLGCVTRLYNLHLPATPVYDETHVGRFLNWYHDGAFFFDVHGPLSKLLMYWTSSALGFEGRASCPYDSTAPFAAECSLAPQRLFPALCGAVMVPLTFATCCALRLHPLAALLCTWFVLVDTLFLGVSRVHLNDMVQMLFIALTHHLAIYACRVPLPTAPAASQPGDGDGGHANSAPSDTPPPSPQRMPSALVIAATGCALGCALQCKYAMALTTLAWLGLQNLVVLADVAARSSGVVRMRALLREALLRGVLLLGLPLAIHLALLHVHLSYVPRTGNGDNYMSIPFQSTLIGNPHHTATNAEERPGFFALALEHARTQFWYNRNMAIMFPRGSHPFDSPWYTWPLAARGIYASLVSDWGRIAQAVDGKHLFGIFLHPNPLAVLLTSSSAAAAVLVLLIRTTRVMLAFLPFRSPSATRRELVTSLAASVRPDGSGSLAVAYLLHWLPYATQDRQTFLLYYLPAYYFTILLLGRLWHECGCALLRPSVALACTLALGAAVGRVSWHLAPMAYGLPVRVHEWSDALKLASTECWGPPLGDGVCWADASRAGAPMG